MIHSPIPGKPAQHKITADYELQHAQLPAVRDDHSRVECKWRNLEVGDTLYFFSFIFL